MCLYPKLPFALEMSIWPFEEISNLSSEHSTGKVAKSRSLGSQASISWSGGHFKTLQDLIQSFFLKPAPHLKRG